MGNRVSTPRLLVMAALGALQTALRPHTHTYGQEPWIALALTDIQGGQVMAQRCDTCPCYRFGGEAR